MKFTNNSITETGADGNFCCHICLKFSKQGYKGKWVLKASFTGHAVHHIHLNALKNKEEFLLVRAQDVPENYATSQDIVMDSFGLWGGIETLPDDDMENIEQLWQENEQDDLLSELLEHTSRCQFH